MNISVENDPEMSSLIDERMTAARVADGLPDYISPEDRRRIINLEIERNKIGEAAFGTAQAKMNAMRMEEIDAEISSIVETAKANQPVAEAAQPVQTSVDAKAKKREEEIRKRGLDKLFPVDIDETTKEGKKLLEEKEAQEKAIAELDAELSALEAAEAVQSEPATPPAPTPGQTTYIEDVINRPVTLVSFNGTPLEQPVQGDMYVDGQTLVVETPDRVSEIGNALELSPTPLAELGIEPQQETVTVGTDGTIQVEGESFLMQTQLPTMGIEYDADGNVTQVSLEALDNTNEEAIQAELVSLVKQKEEAIAAVSSQPGAKLTKKQQARVDKISAEFDAKMRDVEARKSGQKKTFTGQQAEDIAYQILLSQAESAEQAQRIDQILEEVAELKRLHDEYVRSKTEGRVDKPRETQAAPQKRPTADTKKSTKPAEPAKPKSSPVREPEPPKPTELPKGLERLLRVLSIETNPVRMASYVHQIEEAVSRGVQLSAKMRAEVEAAKKIVADAGYTVETPGLGKDYVPDPSDEVVMITSSDIPDGEKRVVSVGRPRVLRNGKVTQNAKVVVAYGTGTPDKAMTPKQRTEAETLKNPRSKKQLQDTLERIFGLPKDKAKASAAIADKMVGTMAKRAGIKKEEMYGRINWMRSNSVDALGNSVPTGVEPVVLFQENIEISEWRITQDFFKNTAEFEQLKADGVFVDDASVKEIMDKVGVVFHAPDSMSGSKVKNGDTTILDGQGGVFYPILPGFRENGYFWASTEKAADRLAKTLNEAAAQARESGDGKVRLILVTSPLEKLTSSTSANQAFVRLLKSFMEDKKSPLNKQVVKAALIAGNLRLGEKKKPLGAKVKASDSVDTMIQVILDKLESENSTFDTRKAFFYGVAMSLSDSASKDKALRDKLIKFLNEFSNRKYWPPVNGTKNQQGKLSMTDIVAALSYAFTEPAIRDISPDVYKTDDRAEIHMAYAVVEADVSQDGDTFEFVMTKEAGLPTHASYPSAIRLKNPDAKVTLKMFQDTIHARSLIINPKTGKVAQSYDEYLSLLPTNTGMSNVVSTTTVSTDPYDPAVAAVTKVEIDKEAIANGAKAEVDRIKGLPIETEDGSTFNADGSMFTEGSGLVVPVASLNTTQAELTSDMVADYIESMKEAFSTNDVKFGLYKFEDSDKVSIDINIVIPEDKQALAVKFGKFAGQNSIFRLSDFSTVKTGASGKNPREFSLNQYAEIASRFKNNSIESFIQNNVGTKKPKQTLYQGARAAIVIEGSEAVIHAITDPDVTSPLHELAHLYETFLTDEERQSILDWAGHSEWTRDTSEAFAMGFEKYLYEGKTSVPGLKTAFEKFRQWVFDVYSAISGTPLELELNDKMRSIYETMLSETEPENITHVQNPDNGVYYQGPMNQQGQSTYTPSELSWFQSSLLMFRKKFQDRYADVMFFLEDIKKRGKSISKSADFRMAEDLMHGKTKNDMEAVEGVLKKAQEFMRKNGISSDDLSDYLYALHAPDRNASILASKGVVDGSGMSDAEAQDTRDRLIAKYGESVLEEAADYFRSMLASNRQVMIEFGLESQETIEQWEQTQTYVPLFGIATDEMDSTTTVYPTGGSGIHVYGPTSKRAKGRKSKATNVLANIVSASLALRIKARKNEALQTMYNLVQDNPSDIWSIKTESEKDDMHSVGVRIDGKQFYIRFKDAEKAKSLKNMGVDKTNFFNHALKVLPTSWLRKSFTVYDPEFVISNFIRDLEGAILNIGVEGAKNGIVEGVDLTNEIAKIKKNVWPVMKTLVAMAHGRSGDARIAQYYEDLKEDGGITGWVQLQTLGDIAKNIERELDPSAFHIAKDKAGAVFRYIEGINDAIEQTVRLTTYIAAVEAGVSREKAAQLSKNITVNFNRYGEYGITLNQFKLFFNASIQGSYRVLTTLGRFRQDRDAQGNLKPIYNRLTKSQKMAMGLFAMNAAITAWNIAMSEDDDDGESYYKKISDNDKQRHLIIMYDGQHFIKVPMAYGFNVITSASEAITSAAMGVRDADDAFWFTLSSTINAFSPIQFGDYTTWEKAGVTLITPSGASAIVESALNETFMGGEVFREQLPFGTPSPENQLSFKSPMWLRDAASFINEMTGGSEYVPGDFDVNPDRLWHYLNFYVGGLGRFVGRSGEAILSVKEMAQSGRAIRMSSNDLPFLRKIYGEPSRYYDYKLFQENMIRSQQLLDEYQDPKARRSDRDRYGKIYVVESARKVAEKQLKELRAKMREAEKIEDYVTRRNRIFDLFEEQRQVMMRFNKIYNEKGPQED